MRDLIPVLVPRIVVSVIVRETFRRVFLWSEYLGHSRRMCSLVWMVSLSHGQVMGSSEWGRKACRNSPVYECPVLHWVRRPKSSRLFLS